MSQRLKGRECRSRFRAQPSYCPQKKASTRNRRDERSQAVAEFVVLRIGPFSSPSLIRKTHR
jgi:hypothetical protein